MKLRLGLSILNSSRMTNREWRLHAVFLHPGAPDGLRGRHCPISSHAPSAVPVPLADDRGKNRSERPRNAMVNPTVRGLAASTEVALLILSAIRSLCMISRRPSSSRILIAGTGDIARFCLSSRGKTGLPPSSVIHELRSLFLDLMVLL